jgi:hypothetical protein
MARFSLLDIYKKPEQKQSICSPTYRYGSLAQVTVAPRSNAGRRTSNAKCKQNATGIYG